MFCIDLRSDFKTILDELEVHFGITYDDLGSILHTFSSIDLLLIFTILIRKMIPDIPHRFAYFHSFSRPFLKTIFFMQLCLHLGTASGVFRKHFVPQTADAVRGAVVVEKDKKT